jgi:hypothetical protein
LVIDHPQLRIYALRGKHTILAWCRDRQNDWRSELEEAVPPRILDGVELDITAFQRSPHFDKTNVEIYDPWQGRWASAKRSGAKVLMPTFQRSVVVRITRAPAPATN